MVRPMVYSDRGFRSVFSKNRMGKMVRHLAPSTLPLFTLLAVAASRKCSADPLAKDQQKRAAWLRIVAD